MPTIKASEFTAKCLDLLDEVARTGAAWVITKNGVPVAQLVPIGNKVSILWGLHAGAIELAADIVEPIDVAWEASP